MVNLGCQMISLDVKLHHSSTGRVQSSISYACIFCWNFVRNKSEASMIQAAGFPLDRVIDNLVVNLHLSDYLKLFENLYNEQMKSCWLYFLLFLLLLFNIIILIPDNRFLVAAPTMS